MYSVLTFISLVNYWYINSFPTLKWGVSSLFIFLLWGFRVNVREHFWILTLCSFLNMTFRNWHQEHKTTNLPIYLYCTNHSWNEGAVTHSNWSEPLHYLLRNNCNSFSHEVHHKGIWCGFHSYGDICLIISRTNKGSLILISNSACWHRHSGPIWQTICNINIYQSTC